MGNKRKSKLGIICERCGKTIGSGQVSHFVACRNTPKPKDLAAIYLSDSSVSIADLGMQYNVSPGFVRQHLLDGGVTMEEIMKRRNLLTSQNWEKSRIPKGARKCRNCQMLIYRDKEAGDIQRDCGGYCPDCAGVGVRRVSEHEYDVVGVAW